MRAPNDIIKIPPLLMHCSLFRVNFLFYKVRKIRDFKSLLAFPSKLPSLPRHELFPPTFSGLCFTFLFFPDFSFALIFYVVFFLLFRLGLSHSYLPSFFFVLFPFFPRFQTEKKRKNEFRRSKGWGIRMWERWNTLIRNFL